jgi:hypothetical protein
VHDDVQGLRGHVQNGIHDDVQGKRVRKADVQHVRRHVRGVRNGVREDGRQDGRVQAVRRGVQKVRPGMQKHDEVTPYFLFTKTVTKTNSSQGKIQMFLLYFVLKTPLIFMLPFSYKVLGVGLKQDTLKYAKIEHFWENRHIVLLSLTVIGN